MQNMFLESRKDSGWLRTISKHLKGQLDPSVGNGHVFCTKGGQLNIPVGNGHFFCTKGGQLDPPVGNGHFFAPKEVC